MIKAVTFDLWDTMIHDDSDEAKRKAQGLRSKKTERRHHLGKGVLGQLAAEPLERDLQPLGDGPGDEKVVPDMVEGRIGHVIGEGHALGLDRLDRVQRFPQQMAALRFLRPKSPARHGLP